MPDKLTYIEESKNEFLGGKLEEFCPRKRKGHLKSGALLNLPTH
jgi:hypothetical protein